MNQININKIAAFTLNGQGGNSAGLVWPADSLVASKRQELATKAGYSETAFVDRSPAGDLRFEYFTPNRQIDICGHATVAAFSYLRDIGKVALGQQHFDSLIGKQKVEVRSKTVGLWQEQLSYKVLIDEKLEHQITSSLNLDSDKIVKPLRIASNGAPFLLVELRDRDSLKNIVPNQEKILKFSEDLELVGFYVYYKKETGRIEARMFAPLYGIEEESATGMAAGALALVLHQEIGESNFTIEQGDLMPKPSPSRLYCEVHAGLKVLVSGEAILEEGSSL